MRSTSVRKPTNIKKAASRPVRKNTLLSVSVKKAASRPVRKNTLSSVSNSRNTEVRPQKLALQKFPPWLRRLQEDAERFIGIYELKKHGPLKRGLSMKLLQESKRVRNVSTTSNDDAVFVKPTFFAIALSKAYPFSSIDGSVPPGSDGPDPLSKFTAIFSLAIVEREPNISDEKITRYLNAFDPILTCYSYDQFNKRVLPQINPNGVDSLSIPLISFKCLRSNLANERDLNDFKERLGRVIYRLLHTDGYHNVEQIGYEKVKDKKLILPELQKRSNKEHKPNENNTFYKNKLDTNWILSKNYSDHKSGAYKLFHLKKGYVGECNGMVMIPHAPGDHYISRAKTEKTDIKKILFLIPSLILN